jgi:tetratricopeptide (TPR) repeat protein
VSASHPKIRVLLRNLYLLEFEKARAQVDELMDLDEPFGRLADALFSFYLGEFEEAIELFDELEEEGLQDPAVYLYRAFCLKELERLPEAVVSLEAGVACYPDDASIVSALGDLYTETGEPAKALECLRTDLGRQGAFESLRARGQALEKLDEPAEAVDAYMQAIREFPFDEELMNRVRALCVAHDLVELGVKFFSQLQKKRQLDRVPSLYNLARLYLHQGKAHRVDEVGKRLEVLAGNDYFALAYLTRLLYQQGKRKKIKMLVSRFLGPETEVVPEIRATVLSVCARVYQDEGRTDKARATIEEGLKASPFHRDLTALQKEIG